MEIVISGNLNCLTLKPAMMRSPKITQNNGRFVPWQRGKTSSADEDHVFGSEAPEQVCEWTLSEERSVKSS